MKKFILFLGFVLCFTLVSSTAMAEVSLEKNADGGCSAFEKNLLKDGIPPLPHGINLDGEKIVKFSTEKGIGKYPVEKTIVTTLFPLPLKEKVITKSSFFFQKGKEWITGSQEIRGPQKVDYGLFFLLIIILILAKTITLGNNKGEVWLKEKIVIDVLILFIAGGVATGSVGVTGIIATGTSIGIAIAIVATIIAIATIIATIITFAAAIVAEAKDAVVHCYNHSHSRRHHRDRRKFLLYFSILDFPSRLHAYLLSSLIFPQENKKGEGKPNSMLKLGETVSCLPFLFYKHSIAIGIESIIIFYYLFVIASVSEAISFVVRDRHVAIAPRDDRM